MTFSLFSPRADLDPAEQKMEQAKRAMRGLLARLDSRAQSLALLADKAGESFRGNDSTEEDARALLALFLDDALCLVPALAGPCAPPDTPPEPQAALDGLSGKPKKLLQELLALADGPLPVSGGGGLQAVSGLAHKLAAALKREYRRTAKARLWTSLDAGRRKRKRLLAAGAAVAVAAWVAVLVVGAAMDRRKAEQAATQMKKLAEVVHLAKTKSGQTLVGLTGNPCTECPCREGDLRQAPADGACRTGLRNAWAGIFRAAGINSQSGPYSLDDPWGAPYLLDENEMEFGSGDCRPDLVRSVGPDHEWGGGDDIEVQVENAFCE